MSTTVLAQGSLCVYTAVVVITRTTHIKKATDLLNRAISYEYLSVLDGSPEVELFLIRKSFSDEITGTENTPSDVIRSPIAIAAVRALEDMHFHTLAPIENDLRVMPHLNGRKWIRDHFSEAKLRAAGVHIE